MLNADATVTPYIALDGILYYILLFLKTAIQDDTAALNYNFYDRNDNTNYEYNNKVRLDLATMGPFDDATFTNMFNHQATIQHLILQRNCELQLTMTGLGELLFSGNWYQILGLSPDG